LPERPACRELARLLTRLEGGLVRSREVWPARVSDQWCEEQPAGQKPGVQVRERLVRHTRRGPEGHLRPPCRPRPSLTHLGARHPEGIKAGLLRCDRASRGEENKHDSC
jgi:hypothetical protein